MENTTQFKPIDTGIGINNTSGLMEFEVLMDLDLAIVGFVLTHLKEDQLIKPEIAAAETISGLKTCYYSDQKETHCPLLSKINIKTLMMKSIKI